MLPHMPVSQEILRNMEGRVARTSPGLTTYLFPFDDAEHALYQHKSKPNSVRDKKMTACVIYGPPERLHLIKHTGKHLQERGFDNICWLCTPGPE